MARVQVGRVRLLYFHAWLQSWKGRKNSYSDPFRNLKQTLGRFHSSVTKYLFETNTKAKWYKTIQKDIQQKHDFCFADLSLSPTTWAFPRKMLPDKYQFYSVFGPAVANHFHLGVVKFLQIWDLWLSMCFWNDPLRHQQKLILKLNWSTKMNLFESSANQDAVAFRSFPKCRLTVVTYGVVHLSGILFGLFSFWGWRFCQEIFRSNQSKLIIHHYPHNLQQLATSFLFIVYLCISRCDLCNILNGSRHLLSLGSAKLSEENSGCNIIYQKI